MFQIEKGVPFAPRKKQRAKPYPFAEMSVGDSFLVMGPREELDKAMAAYYRYKKKFNPFLKLSARVLNDRSGHRIWRIE